MQGLRKVMGYCKEAILLAGGMNLLYLGAIMTTQITTNLASEKIFTQSELERLVAAERKNINKREEYKIIARLSPETAAESGKLGPELYYLKIGGIFANKRSLRHELYHILDDHFDPGTGSASRFIQTLKYLYVYEPQATLYEATGLKL